MSDPTRAQQAQEDRTGQRDVRWPVIDPKVLRLGVSKLRMVDSEWLHQFAANGEIAVFQTADEPLAVLVPYALYQSVQAEILSLSAALRAPSPVEELDAVIDRFIAEMEWALPNLIQHYAHKLVRREMERAKGRTLRGLGVDADS